ncbi:MAG: cytochrome c biogenesis CcdA family protein [Candidatus Bathyarchaeia archaeon]
MSPNPILNAQPDDLKFYVISCGRCEGYVKRLQILEETYPQIAIIFHDIEEGDNAERFKMIADVLEETLYMPLVGVFRNGALMAIASGGLSAEDWRVAVEYWSEGIAVYVATIPGQAEVTTTVKGPGKSNLLKRLFMEPDISGIPYYTNFSQLSLIVVAAAAIDAVNPCCFGVLVILLTFVFYGVGKNAVLKVGLAFTGGLFFTYFLMGLGLSRFFQHIPAVKYLIAALAFAFGFLRILEALGRRVKHVPDAFTVRISKRLEEATSPGSGLIAGVVTGSLLLPCSSAPYFVVLSLLSERASFIGGLTLLALYNLIITVPFLVITLVVHGLVMTTMELKLWSLENRRWVNLLMGLALVALSLLSLLI